MTRQEDLSGVQDCCKSHALFFFSNFIEIIKHVD